MRSVATPDGRTLTVREGGDPTGFPVLFISGTPGSSTLSEHHARDAAERGIRLFSYDRPGYGASTRHKGRAVADCAASHRNDSWRCVRHDSRGSIDRLPVYVLARGVAAGSRTGIAG